MIQEIVNGAPMIINYGIDDKSKRSIPYQSPSISQHLPKYFIYAQKGPEESTLVSPNDLIRLYGEDTFDPNKKFFNHSTVFLRDTCGAPGLASSAIVKRIIPSDAGPNASIILYIDILETDVDLYERTAEGLIKYDSLGSPHVIGTTPGSKIKWTSDYHRSLSSVNTPGELTSGLGTQTDSTGRTSVRYPIFEFKVRDRGADGNNGGVRLWSPTYLTEVNMHDELLNTTRVYPYYVSLVNRKDEKSPVKEVRTRRYDTRALFTFAPGAINPRTQSNTYMKDVLNDEYNDPQYGLTSNFDDVFIYQEYLETVLAKMHVTEKAFIDIYSDISVDESDLFLMNIIGLTTSRGTPYHSVQFSDDFDAVIMSRYGNIFANGGVDGTMNDSLFAQSVEHLMEEYADPDAEIQDFVLYPETVIYDTGFPLSTKRALAKFIAVRKNTAVALSTYVAKQPKTLASDDFSIGSALKTYVDFYPESDYFGTPTVRGIIVPGSSLLLNSKYRERVPTLYEVAMKSARYMGAATGSWRTEEAFDEAPGNVLAFTYDHSQTWLPASARNNYWAQGINWIQAYDYRRFQFPALKTVYGSTSTDDTSVLNSWFTVIAASALTTIGAAAYREIVGTSSKSPAKISDKMTAFINGKTRGAFDNRFVIIPEVTFDELDLLRGYSWHLVFKMYAENMRTVMTTWVETYRISDLEELN